MPVPLHRFAPPRPPPNHPVRRKPTGCCFFCGLERFDTPVYP